jgi:hypothetical protein
MTKTSLWIALMLGLVMFLPLQTQAKSKKISAKASLQELERLDSAANLLLSISDSDHSRQCHIRPGEAQKLLMAIHPMIDESRKKAASSLLVGLSSNGLVNRDWERSCSKSCHCGLYASVLEEVGEVNLNEQARDLVQRLNEKEQHMTPQEVSQCSAVTEKWFCKSGLLRQLRRNAKSFPSPAHRSK